MAAPPNPLQMLQPPANAEQIMQTVVMLPLLPLQLLNQAMAQAANQGGTK